MRARLVSLHHHKEINRLWFDDAALRGAPRADYLGLAAAAAHRSSRACLQAACGAGVQALCSCSVQP